MNIQRSDIEIMAPVGSFESLQAAIQGGADAVYFGAGHLNMRAQSSINFNLDDLQEIVTIAREHQLKTYLTLNTVMFDHEINQVHEIIDHAKKNGIDAIIATDHSVIQYAHEVGLPVHASTQVNISNTEALKFYAPFIDVAVLARELNLNQVSTIAQNIDKAAIRGPSGEKIRLEMFVHGALCMSISGKCYLSLHEKNHSANRGHCLQTCRKAYTVTEKENGEALDIENEYIMSPKDLCTIHFLNKILDAGVRVLKIEGRARGPEYVKTVTSCYAEAVQSILENNFTREKIDAWMERLSRVFNRGFWDGYYLGQRLGAWSHVYGSQATHRKRYIGKVTNYFTNIRVAELKIETGQLHRGDEILIIGPTTGVLEETVKEIRVDLQHVDQAQKGELCSIPIDTFLRRSDKIYLWEHLEQKEIW